MNSNRQGQIAGSIVETDPAFAALMATAFSNFADYQIDLNTSTLEVKPGKAGGALDAVESVKITTATTVGRRSDEVELVTVCTHEIVLRDKVDSLDALFRLFLQGDSPDGEQVSDR